MEKSTGTVFTVQMCRKSEQSHDHERKSIWSKLRYWLINYYINNNPAERKILVLYIHKHLLYDRRSIIVLYDLGTYKFGLSIWNKIQGSWLWNIYRGLFGGSFGVVKFKYFNFLQSFELIMHLNVFIVTGFNIKNIVCSRPWFE